MRGFTNDNSLTFIGRTTFRNERRLFGIRQADRRQHLYVIGETGTGKSTVVLEALMRQDLVNGAGFALIDPVMSNNSIAVVARPDLDGPVE